MVRLGWSLLVCCLGCGMLPRTDASAGRPVEAGVRAQGEDDAPARKDGLAAPAGQADLSLQLATACLEHGREAEAAEHLESFVKRRPEQLVVRAQLAELLFRLKKLEDARFQFDLFIALAQEQPEQGFRFLIHSHSRLVEIAEEQEDAYLEHLNRGIGLYLLACRRAKEPDPDGELSADSLLCRATLELQKARNEQPDEARPYLYLYRAWSRLGQGRTALRALRAADERALLARLTPSERRELHAACLRERR